MVYRYFELEDNVEIKGRWFLNGLFDKDGRKLDSRDFRYGIPVDVGPPLKVSLSDEDTIVAIIPPLKVAMRRKGKALDFTFADFDMPVVSARVAELLAEIAGSDIQRIPVGIESRGGEYEILNVISCLPCIDPTRSEIEWWTDEDDRPDKIGKPQMISKLIIDPTLTKGSQILRPEGWEVTIIVSEMVKNAFEDANVTGVRFREV